MSSNDTQELIWYRVGDNNMLDVGRITTVEVGQHTVCLTRTDKGYGTISNKCPHQGGPLGNGFLQDGCVVCPWHAWEYDPHTGKAPEGYEDEGVPAYAVAERKDGVYVGVYEEIAQPSLMDQMVGVMTEWGIDTVFGMVGHSNLGVAEAFYKAERAGRLRYYGIRHEGAAAFAAVGYAKLTGRPAACFSIAGPGATNLLTGLWDAKNVWVSWLHWLCFSSSNGCLGCRAGPPHRSDCWGRRLWTIYGGVHNGR